MITGTNKFPISSCNRDNATWKAKWSCLILHWERKDSEDEHPEWLDEINNREVLFLSSNVKRQTRTDRRIDTIKTLNAVHAHALAKVGENSGISSACPWLSRGRRVTGSRTRIQDRDGTEIRSTAAWSRVQVSERDESSPPFLSSRVDAPRPPVPSSIPLPVASLSPPSWTRNNITDVATTVVETIPGKDRGIENLFSVVGFNYEKFKLIAIQ